MGIASDIPAGYSDASAMARALVTYIKCDRRVQSEVRSHFTTSPSLSSIRDMRVVHMNRRTRDDLPAYGASEAYCRQREVDSLDPINRKFVEAIKVERNRSANRKELEQMARAAGIKV